MKKRWVIPDIHGCNKTLQNLINNKIQPARSDSLYFLGDYIDRGPDSKGVIDFLISLEEDEYDVHFLKGNHEDYLLRLHEACKNQKKILGFPVRNKLKADWFKNGGKISMQSFGLKKAKEIPEKYIKWMEKLHNYIELDDYFLVHAGFNFDAEDPFSDVRSMLWIKEFKVDLNKSKNKKVIHGHVPVSLDFIELVKNKPSFDFIDLDNGVYIDDKDGFGNLVALELNSGELMVQPNIDQ